jgi:hypothetical protein
MALTIDGAPRLYADLAYESGYRTYKRILAPHIGENTTPKMPLERPRSPRWRMPFALSNHQDAPCYPALPLQDLRPKIAIGIEF